MSAVELVHYEERDAVGVITLDSPTNRNALSQQLVRELTEHLRTADHSDRVRAVLLTHTGTTFCAGADLREAVELGMEEGTRTLLRLLRTVLDLSTPVVAVVRGHVRAGGVGLVGACDIAVSSTDATYAFSEALLGLTPAIISLTTRTRMGERDAAHKYLTGATFDGAEAARSGLVTTAVPADELDATVADLERRFQKVSPQGLRETKALLTAPMRAAIAEEGEALVALSARLFASEEAREGMTAFRERRAPRWAPTEDR